MKNQYFGDDRDLFKYDLVHKVINAGYAGLPTRFTLIPMLTKDEGRKKGKPGTKHPELVNFLNACTTSEKRNIRQLEAFFKDKISIYGANDHFCSESSEMRNEYFKQVRCHLLQKSLILVDPDIGIENGKLTEKHLQYSEVKELYDNMGSDSILMIFQFIPREKRETYFPRICGEFKQKVGNLPIYISDNQIVFFFLAKDKSLRNSLGNVISDYKASYPKLIVGNIK